MAEAAFSENGKYYASISQDGRLKIWDTETNILKQEYTPDLHLSSPPCCLQWLNIATNATPQKNVKRKNSITEPDGQCIALGTRNGRILLYTVAQAKVETVLSDEKNVDIGKHVITALDWHRKYGLYSCNKHNLVVEWDLQSVSIRNKYNLNFDSKNKQANCISAIKIVPHKQNTAVRYLVTASWQIRLWRLHNEEAIIVKSLGHSVAPKAILKLVTLKDRNWIIEGSQTERLLSFWDVSITSDCLPQINGEDIIPNKKQRKKSLSETSIVPNPMYNFVLEDAPKMIDVLVRDDQGTKLTLAAATRSGVLHYYEHILNGSSTKPIKPSVTIHVTTPDARPLLLQCCSLPQDGDIVLGYMNEPIVFFEKIVPDLKSKTQVIIRGESQEKKKKIKDTSEVNKVRSDSNKGVTYVEPMGGVSRKRPSPGAKVEVPMEARLANLALDVKSRSKSAVNQNLTKLLVQGLHSKDKGLILTVLQKDNAQVASRTVADLPANYVPRLLEELIDMATRKTSQCSSVCTWLLAVLRSHSALLLATINSSTSDHLMQLLAIFTQRRSHLCQLLNLKGRIDLTISQRTAQEAAQENQDALLEYNDTSSDEDMEVEKYQSENSDESWGDGGDSDEGENGSDEESDQSAGD